MTTRQLLKNRYTTFLEWNESWTGLDKHGSDSHVNITICASVHDCMKLQRMAERRAKGFKKTRLDAHLIKDFVAINWAGVKEEAR